MERPAVSEPSRKQLETPAAVVFDSDGVLVDTQASWAAARRALFAWHDQEFGPAEERETVGTGVAGTTRLLARLLRAPERSDELSEQLLELLVAEVSRQPSPALPGAIDLVYDLRGRLPIAVASNAPAAVLEGVLGEAGLAAAFEVVLGADDVSRGKPAPDLYLAASARLGARPAKTVAVEDSPAGVAAARAAGLQVIGISRPGGIRLEADNLAESLTDPSVRNWLGIDR